MLPMTMLEHQVVRFCLRITTNSSIPSMQALIGPKTRQFLLSNLAPYCYLYDNRFLVLA